MNTKALKLVNETLRQATKAAPAKERLSEAQFRQLLQKRQRLAESSDCDSPLRAVTKEAAEPLAKTFVQYVKNGNSFRPAGSVTLVNTLAPCAFSISRDMGGIFFERVKPSTDDMLLFENSAMNKVLIEIDKFWESKAKYDRLGLTHNRGILLHGSHGNGKSICLQQVAEMMAKRGDVVFFANSPDSILEGVGVFKQVEPERKVVVCFEEVDDMASYGERTLLRLLDGDAKIGGVLYLATTNYIERMSPRLLRPGRFDHHVHVGPPVYEQRHKYFSKKLEGIADSVAVEHLAKYSDGMNFGEMRELIVGIYAIGDPVDEVLKKLRGSKPINSSQQRVSSYLGL